MQCSEVHDLLLDYIRGIPDQETTRLINDHLINCQECAREIKEYLPMANLTQALRLTEIKAPKEHREGVLKIVKARASKGDKPDSSSPLARFIKWLTNKLAHPLAHPFIPAVILTSVMILMIGIWMATHYIPDNRQITLKVVEDIYWPSDQSGLEEGGIAGPSPQTEQNKTLSAWFSIPLPVSALLPLAKGLNQDQLIHLFRTISLELTEQSGRTEKNVYAANLFRNIAEQINTDGLKRWKISIRIEQKLLDFLQSTKEEEIVVRVGCQVTGQAITLEFGRGGVV